MAPDELETTLARLSAALTWREEEGLLKFEYLTSALQETRFGGATTFANFLLFSQTAPACGHPEGPRIRAMLRFEDDQPIAPELTAEIEAIAAPLTGEIHWSAGDLAMIDNTRMMHGRHAFNDPKREIYVRMCRSVPW